MGGTAAHPLDAAGSVELAVLDRSGLDESRHLGAAVVVDADGTVLEAHGDQTAVVYPRSSLKPFQAAAAAATGLALDDEELVLATASHAGSDRHVAVVERMLAQAGLDEDALQCPADLPGDRVALAAGRGAARVRMNCSGKHAAFLGASVHRGWSTSDYLDPAHPLQRAIVDLIEQRCGERVAHSGIDGCGAPVHALTLPAVARGAAAVLAPGERLAAGVLAHPWAIDGEGRPNTVAIEHTGAVVKGGAEGYLIAVAPGGAAVALKVLDGSARVAAFVGLSLLARVGALDPDGVREAIAALNPPATGGDVVVGGWRLTV